jgi:hypothetical protein
MRKFIEAESDECQAPFPRLTKFMHRSSCHLRSALHTTLPRASMAPRLRNTLAKSLSRSLDNSAVFYCPSCAVWLRSLSTRADTTRRADKPDSSRRAGRAQKAITGFLPRTFSTSHVITAKSVPPRFKELHAALEAVKDADLEQVNLSRLQFALRGLESETPLIRVAGE